MIASEMNIPLAGASIMRNVLVLLVLGFSSVASADNFRFSYGNRGQSITGYTYNYGYGFGGGARAYDTQGNTYNFQYQPTIYPAYGYPVYRAPVLNDYYRMNRGGGYGMGW